MRPNAATWSLNAMTAASSGLMPARRTGEAGHQGNTVGQYLCTDLACSLYTRGKKQSASGAEFAETLSVDEKIARTRFNLTAFIDKVIE